jgi:6-phosphogluconolactonase/glucosamine-6-phosphate isomerase/deaminase
MSLVEHAAKWCEEKTNDYQAKSVFLPAGQTPLALYKYWQQTRPAYLSHLKFRQIDDIQTGRQKGHFRRFFEENLAFYLKQFEFIDQLEFIEEQPAEAQPALCDLAILGFGRNGHVAFHEPGLASGFNVGCVRLAPETCRHLKLEDETWGLTYGVDAFFRAKAILLIVSGDGKEQAYQAFKERRPEIPATYLADHPDITVMVQGYK